MDARWRLDCRALAVWLVELDAACTVYMVQLGVDGIREPDRRVNYSEMKVELF